MEHPAAPADAVPRGTLRGGRPSPRCGQSSESLPFSPRTPAPRTMTTETRNLAVQPSQALAPAAEGVARALATIVVRVRPGLPPAGVEAAVRGGHRRGGTACCPILRRPGPAAAMRDLRAALARAPARASRRSGLPRRASVEASWTGANSIAASMSDGSPSFDNLQSGCGRASRLVPGVW